MTTKQDTPDNINVELDKIDNILTSLVDEWQDWLHNGKPGEGAQLIKEAKQAIQQIVTREEIETLQWVLHQLSFDGSEDDVNYLEKRIAELQAQLTQVGDE
jgi:polyhydroxyalkanoate synthesis regulator phasin